jgi:hypothetical protein
MIDTIVLPDPTADLWVACLCAAWCRTCDAYQETLDAVTGEFRGVRAHWIDIEDEADALGDVDIETFPTILIADGARLLFGGPVPPDAGSLRRLMQAARSGSLAARDADPALVALAQRLRERAAD